MSGWYTNNSDVGYVDEEWKGFGMLHSQKPPFGDWVLNGDEDECPCGGECRCTPNTEEEE